MPKASVKGCGCAVEFRLTHQPCLNTARTEYWRAGQDHPVPLARFPDAVADLFGIVFRPQVELPPNLIGKPGAGDDAVEAALSSAA